jgi:hypothetical protein
MSLHFERNHMNRLAGFRLGLAALVLTGCATNAPQVPLHADDPYGAVIGDFCWSKAPLLQKEKTCAPLEEQLLAQDACTRTALNALTHSHAANRDWFGMCMARYGLSRLATPGH